MPVFLLYFALQLNLIQIKKMNKADMLLVVVLRRAAKGGRGRKERSRDVIEVATPMKILPAIFANFVISDIKTITKYYIQAFADQ